MFVLQNDNWIYRELVPELGSVFRQGLSKLYGGGRGLVGESYYSVTGAGRRRPKHEERAASL
jgi:hypothetical protein